MPKFNVYSVFDRKAKAYLMPFLAENDDLAVRIFQVNCDDVDSQFHRFPDDFYLFRLAEWDNVDGTYVNEDAPLSLGNAMGLVAPRPKKLEVISDGE